MTTTYVLLAGLPATGKSTLARALAGHLGGVVLDKDLVRAALFGDAVDYSQEQNDVCMRAMLDAAAYLTANGLAPFVFFDGRTFSRQTQLQPVIEAAEALGARWRILHLKCSDAVAEARLRSQDHTARDRNFALYKSVQASFEPIALPCLEIDTSSGTERLLDKTIEYLMKG